MSIFLGLRMTEDTCFPLNICRLAECRILGWKFQRVGIIQDLLKDLLSP